MEIDWRPVDLWFDDASSQLYRLVAPHDHVSPGFTSVCFVFAFFIPNKVDNDDDEEE